MSQKNHIKIQISLIFIKTHNTTHLFKVNYHCIDHRLLEEKQPTMSKSHILHSVEKNTIINK